MDVEVVQRVDVQRHLEVTGTLAAADEVVVAAEVDGRVVRVLADLGDRVRAGQALVELDPEKLRYRAEEQRASLRKSFARYGVTGRDESLPAVDDTPEVKRANAELQQAELVMERAAELHRRSLLSKQDLENAQLRRTMAAAAQDAAIYAARNLRADIDASEAGLHLAERELLDATIRAPFDGYIKLRQVSPGEFVRLQTPVVTLVRVDPLKLTTEFPEQMMPWVRPGQKIAIRTDAYPDRTVEGTISRVSPSVNAATRAFAIEASVPNQDGKLKPGTFARARLASDLVEPVITIPAVAIQNRYGVNRVFVVAGGTLSAREVTLGDRVGERVEIAEGLTAGDTVALSNVDTLADGMPVRGVSRQAQAK